MDEQITLIAERYLGMLRQIEAIVLAIKGDLDLTKLVTAIQVVHLEQVRRCHDTLQGLIPEGEREKFSEYLKELAVAVERAQNAEPPPAPIQESPPKETTPIRRVKPKKS